MNNDTLKTTGIIGGLLLIAIIAGSLLKQTIVIPGATNERVVPIVQSSNSTVASTDEYGTGVGIRTILNDLKIGSSGVRISTMLYATGTRNFDSIVGTNNLVGNTTSTLLTVTGAVTGDPCFIDLPSWGNAAAGTAATSTVAWDCKTVNTNTVLLTAHNTASSTAEDIPSKTFGAFVIHANQ